MSTAAGCEFARSRYRGAAVVMRHWQLLVLALLRKVSNLRIRSGTLAAHEAVVFIAERAFLLSDTLPRAHWRRATDDAAVKCRFFQRPGPGDGIDDGRQRRPG